MNIPNIDCSVLNDVIAESFQEHPNDDRIVEHILTDMVENGYVDRTWGNLVYTEDGGYRENGMEIDDVILNKLEHHITEHIKNLSL